MTKILPRHQYTASDETGQNQTSRFSAKNDTHARNIAARLLGGSIPEGVKVWEIIPGNRETFREVEKP